MTLAGAIELTGVVLSDNGRFTGAGVYAFTGMIFGKTECKLSTI
jgi:hypothetical protein